MAIGAIIKNATGPVISSVVGGTVSAMGAANVLPVLGFGAAGVTAASAASCVQAGVFGAAVPAGSWFAVMTSWGATGAMSGTLAAVAGPVGAVAAGAGWYYFRG